MGTSGGQTVTTIRKSADETVNNSDVVQNDDHLFFAIGANEEWIVEWTLFVTATSSSPDMDIAVTLPASPASVLYSVSGARSIDTVVTAFAAASASGTEIGPVGVTISVINSFRVVGRFVNGSTAGNVRLQWAQSVATAADTTVKAGSFLKATRVA